MSAPAPERQAQPPALTTTTTTTVPIPSSLQSSHTPSSSSSPLTPDIYTITTPAALAALVRLLIDRARASDEENPRLFLALDGPDLGRQGAVSCLTLALAPARDVFIVDVQRLGKEAFETPAEAPPSGAASPVSPTSPTTGTGTGTGTGNAAPPPPKQHTLGSIIRGTALHKVFYDLRAAHDALAHHYDVHLDPSADGVLDLQLWQVATRPAGDARQNPLLDDLWTAVRADAGLSRGERTALDEVIAANANGHGQGDSDNNNNKAPSASASPSNEYRAAQVALLPRLHEAYGKRISREWRERCEEETVHRIALAKHGHWSSRNKANAKKPAGW